MSEMVITTEQKHDTGLDDKQAIHKIVSEHFGRGYLYKGYYDPSKGLTFIRLKYTKVSTSHPINLLAYLDTIQDKELKPHKEIG